MVFDGIWAILMLIAASIVTDYARKYSFMDSYAAGAVNITNILIVFQPFVFINYHV